MTYDGLLAFVAIIVGAYAILSPDQRASFRMFFPVVPTLAAVVWSLALIVWPLSLQASGVELTAGALFICRVCSFLLPSLTLVWSVFRTLRRRLNTQNAHQLPNLVSACIRQNQFDEIAAVLSSNIASRYFRPEYFGGRTADLLFEPDVVRSVLASRSLIHLELLQDVDYLSTLDDRYGAVDAVVRQLVTGTYSPLRKMVMQAFGTSDEPKPTHDEMSLLMRTLFDAEWYFRAGAHYPLVMLCQETLQSGTLDVTHNQANANYSAGQGLSSRADCPVFIAMKTHVLALNQAIEQAKEGYLYVDNLRSIFCQALERSKFTPAVWHEHMRVSSESPTPYAYLLKQIVEDLEELAERTVTKAMTEKQPSSEAMDEILRQVAVAWAHCANAAARQHGNVSSAFSDGIVTAYLYFTLRLKHAPYDITGVSAEDSQSSEQEVWYAAFVNSLVEAFQWNDGSKTTLFDCLGKLDYGKRWVQDGRPKLQEELTQNLYHRG